MGVFFQDVTMQSFIALVVFIAFLVGVNEITRRSKMLSIGAYCILPAVLAILLSMNILGSPTGNTWFGWVKVISALMGVWGFMLIRFTKLETSKFAVWFPVTILALNIAEAVYREFEVFAVYQELQVDAGGIMIVGGVWNILNAIAGVLCIVTLSGFAVIRVSKDKSRDMIWPDMTWMYIIGYTLWNFAYVYNCISTRSMYAGFAILLAAIIAEYGFKRGAWLQHRAQTLSFYAMISLSFDYQASHYFHIVPNYTEANLMLISSVSILFNIGVFAYMLYTMKRYKRNPFKTSIYTHTNAYTKNIEANGL